MSCVSTSQPIAVRPIAEAEVPAFDHGDTAEKPMPVPSASSASDSAAATNAPAKTAAHDTPDECASFFSSVPVEADDDAGSGSMRCASARVLPDPTLDDS